MDPASRRVVSVEERFGVRNYAPLPVVLTRASGAYAWDLAGRRYLDALSAYSALNQGHNHPRIVAAARRQLGRLSLTSRAFRNDLLGPLLARLCRWTRMEKAILMNSGAEAVETAIKAMRLWGYRVKGIAEDAAEIVVAEGNFHGRTTTIVGFSSDEGSRRYFGPPTPGFCKVPFGDPAALERAVTPRTCGLLLEPIQGEAGVRIPPPGYLRRARELCSRRRVLFCADEIQTGLGRTGRMFAVEREGVRPDLFVLGKALSGGLYPVSAVTGPAGALGLFEPGTHGSTFGGNPLACAIAMAALDVIERERLAERAAELGERLLERLKALDHPRIREVRGAGLLVGIEFAEPIGRRFCEILLRRGVLAKDTHERVVRLAPPLIVTRRQLDFLARTVREALEEL